MHTQTVHLPRPHFQLQPEAWMLRPGPTTSHLGTLRVPQFPHRSSMVGSADLMPLELQSLMRLNKTALFPEDDWEKKSPISY